MDSLVGNLGLVIGIIVAIFFLGFAILIATCYRKVPQGKALIRTGVGGTKVVYESGILVLPVIHMVEIMDLSVKTMEISRMKEEGLICKDNLRADIKVVFFIRINQEAGDIKKVAQTIGAARASDPEVLQKLFEAKFSEALKTVGKRFDFVELYDNRVKFRQEIMGLLDTDLNSYKLEDAAIDYLEQTALAHLNIDNILDSEGIKKITELTATQKIKANFIRREEEKTITEQDVEAREAILEYQRQLAEKEERQKREIANIKARENAEIAKINEEERLRSETVRIRTEEELAIQEENKQRQVIVALKNKERTEAVEIERVEKDRLLEVTERERVVTLAEIEKERSIEVERKNIQDVIRERVMVEKKTVEEEEKIKDTREIATANRAKSVKIIQAEEIGESTIIEQQNLAEAQKIAAEINAQKLLIDAEAAKNAAGKDAEARKIKAEAKAAEEATLGLSEAQVTEAKAHAKELEGIAEANVIEKKANAEAKGIAIKAEAEHKRGLLQAEVTESQGLAEAKVTAERGSSEAKALQEKLVAEAKGVEEKAMAMKKLDGVGKDHEEFKLRLEMDKAVKLAAIQVEEAIAQAQAQALGEAFKSANIDLVGGENTFIQNVMNAVGRGKTIDRMVNNSEVLSEVKYSMLGDGYESGNGGLFSKIKSVINESGVTSEDVKNLTLAALLLKVYNKSSDENRGMISSLMETVKELGIGNQKAEGIL